MRRLSFSATLAAAAIAAFAGATAYAQTTPAPTERPPAEDRTSDRASERFERRAQRMEERMNRRLERLKADLKLTPQQEPLWSPIEAHLRRMQADRRAYWQSHAGRMRSTELPDRIDLMSERMAANATQMRELSARIKPLWATLSDAQKDIVRKAVRNGRGWDRGGGPGGEGGRGERRG